MTDSYSMIAAALIAAASLAALLIIAGTMLKMWQGWLMLRLRELEHLPQTSEPGGSGVTGRIELADLKERIRKLEAIAAGVDL